MPSIIELIDLHKKIRSSAVTNWQAIDICYEAYDMDVLAGTRGGSREPAHQESYILAQTYARFYSNDIAVVEKTIQNLSLILKHGRISEQFISNAKGFHGKLKKLKSMLDQFDLACYVQGMDLQTLFRRYATHLAEVQEFDSNMVGEACKIALNSISPSENNIQEMSLHNIIKIDELFYSTFIIILDQPKKRVNSLAEFLQTHFQNKALIEAFQHVCTNQMEAMEDITFTLSNVSLKRINHFEEEVATKPTPNPMSLFATKAVVVPYKKRQREEEVEDLELPNKSVKLTHQNVTSYY